MTYDDFVATLDGDRPPAGLSGPLQGLWHCAQIEREASAWDTAHDLCNDDPSAASSWVHAWLHRQEGDLPNAAYWYRRAGRPQAHGSLRAEWQEIVRALLSDAD